MARWISDRAKEALRLRDADADGVCRCAYCAREVAVRAHNSNPLAASLDHLNARSAGGELRNPANLVVCCASCNSSRCNDDLQTWLVAKFGQAAADAALARVGERLVRNAQWGDYVAAAKAAGFKA